ncbi:MAG: aminoacyl-tRNA hydrolase [Syntrophomonas sp.]
MKIIVGLGNPGRRYSNTRHNTGFRVVEELAGRYIIEKEESKYDALLGHLRIGMEKIILVKPLTYMNLSGRTVGPLVRWFKLDPGNLLVAYDDMDIEPGKIRIRGSGGSGGHKGMTSIIDSLGTQNFPRIRVGIGRSPEGVIDWVLGEFGKDEKDIMPAAINRAASAAECWVKQGIDAAMNAYN